MGFVKSGTKKKAHSCSQDGPDSALVRSHFLGAGSATAGTTHQNHQVLLSKPSPTQLHFEFQVSPALWLHQVMRPQMSFTDFLKIHAALSEADFQKALKKALRQMEIENFIKLFSGEKLSLIHWRLPETGTLQTLLQKNLLLLELPPQIQAHLEPMVISASVQSKKNLSRIQLTLSPIFIPYWRNTNRTKFGSHRIYLQP
jgi:hypothetical protein